MRASHMRCVSEHRGRCTHWRGSVPCSCSGPRADRLCCAARTRPALRPAGYAAQHAGEARHCREPRNVNGSAAAGLKRRLMTDPNLAPASIGLPSCSRLLSAQASETSLPAPVLDADTRISLATLPPPAFSGGVMQYEQLRLLKCGARRNCPGRCRCCG
jgi:hypothetical protein